MADFDAGRLGDEAPPPASPLPEIRDLGFSDLSAALRAGLGDFRRAPRFGLFFSAVYVLGGFVTYAVYGQLGLPFVVALAASGLTLMAVGALVERFLFRPVIRRSAREESTMLLAAAIAFFLDAVILLLFGEKQRGVPKIVKGVFLSDSVIIPYDRVVVGVVAVLMIATFMLFMQFSRPGRAMRALAQDRVAAQLMGVDVDR